MEKIFRVVSIFPDVLFEGLMQNFCYSVVRAKNVAFEFTIEDFPFMNLNDLITISKILSNFDPSPIVAKKRKTFIIGYVILKPTSMLL